MKKYKLCHICKDPAKYKCDICNLPFCEWCEADYSLLKQIDYNCCKKCEELIKNRGDILMSKIGKVLEQIQVNENDKNRSILDLLMDVVGYLSNANRNKDKRSDLSNITYSEFKDELGSNKRVRIFCNNFYEIYSTYVENNFEDHLACAVIKILEIVKINKVEMLENDYYYKYIKAKYKKYNISNQLFDTIGTIYDQTLDLEDLPILLIKIEVLAELLNIDLYHHVELRLNYNQLK